MIEGLQIKTEREIARDTEATRTRLQAQYCGLCGTRLEKGACPHLCGDPEKERQIGQHYGATIAPRECAICGNEIRPAADKMTGRWWSKPSNTWKWRCECGFTGTFAEFKREAGLRAALVEPTFPDYTARPDW